MAGILIVTVDPCRPAVSGADLRNALIAQSASRLAPVTVASLAGAALPHDAMPVVSLCPEAGALWRRPACGTPIDIALPAAAGERLAALAAKLRPEVAIVEGLPLHPLLPLLKERVPRVVLDLHNIESHRHAQSGQPWIPWARWRRARQAAAITAVERAAAARADALWVCSALDARRLRAVVGDAPAIHVVPNGIPRADELPDSLPPLRDGTAGPVLLLAGHLAYRPNMRAAAIAAREILPRLRQTLPGTRLILAGRAPHARVRALPAEIVADPPAMAPLLRAADIAVLPLLGGGGTRIKALEAMAWGVPLVATPVAVEGLDLADGVHVRLADTPAAFAAAIAALWHDRAARARQRAAARDHALALFGPESVAAAVRDALQALGPRARAMPQ